MTTGSGKLERTTNHSRDIAAVVLVGGLVTAFYALLIIENPYAWDSLMGIVAIFIILWFVALIFLVKPRVKRERSPLD